MRDVPVRAAMRSSVAQRASSSTTSMIDVAAVKERASATGSTCGCNAYNWAERVSSHAQPHST
jgi:hypothetical protein